MRRHVMLDELPLELQRMIGKGDLPVVQVATGSGGVRAEPWRRRTFEPSGGAVRVNAVDCGRTV